MLLACEHFVCRILCMCRTLYSTLNVQRTDLTLTNAERHAVHVTLAVKIYQIKAHVHFLTASHVQT